MRPALPALLTLVPLALGSGLGAQQVVDPSVTVRSRVLLDNPRVVVVERTYEPGAVTDEHTHEFPRTVYVVSGGILELVAADGTETQLEVLRGQALWRPAETHVVRNVGPTRVRVVETELKGTPGA